MSSIKALQTHYDGYHFRSRTEARWAVFFKTLGIAYEYEKEGFDLGGEGYVPDFYLPDFYLPHLELWIEIKGKLNWRTVQTKSGWSYRVSPELELARAFNDAGGGAIAVVVGTPGNEQIYFYARDVCDSGGGRYSREEGEVVWCYSNGIVTLNLFEHRLDRDIVTEQWEPLLQFTYARDYGSSREPLRAAYTAARSARFGT